ncbi:hypothetical protein [uncultured Porphyromonas sp.]|uniref:hypothetical protein n=1 Tax=uncultured Porphyromonas sp. TaxID=159274 RepID=UPI0025FD00F0|nr:hypothetical protein [uncultured Porphyromonas sp.]
MDEEQKAVAVIILTVFILLFIVFPVLGLSDAEPIQYILFIVGYILILASIYIGYVLIMRTLF